MLETYKYYKQLCVVYSIILYTVQQQLITTILVDFIRSTSYTICNVIFINIYCLTTEVYTVDFLYNMQCDIHQHILPDYRGLYSRLPLQYAMWYSSTYIAWLQRFAYNNNGLTHTMREVCGHKWYIVNAINEQQCALRWHCIVFLGRHSTRQQKIK